VALSRDAAVSAQRQWAPAEVLVALLWTAGAAAAAWCAVLATSGADPAGLVIAACAAVGLLATALYATRARPRLRADADGITVGGLLRPRHHPWPLVDGIRLVPTRRLGLSGELLEVDTRAADGTERLLVFGRLDLGAPPSEVADHLTSLRP
jgi:hypothetical protein